MSQTNHAQSLTNGFRILVSRLHNKDETLKTIDLRGCKISGKEIIKLADALPGNPYLSSISLCGCQIGEMNCIYLTERLNQVPNLVHLDLTDNELKMGTVASLIKLLSTHQSIKTLLLGHNFLGDLGYKAIQENINQYPSIREIRLNICGLSRRLLEKEVQQRSSALLQSKQIIRLD